MLSIKNFTAFSIKQIFTFYFLITTFFCFSAFGQAKFDPQISILTPGEPVEGELSGQQSHRYTIEVKANELLQVKVEQKGIDLVVILSSPANQKLIEVDNLNGTHGSEIITHIPETGGKFLIEVKSSNKAAPLGKYNIQILPLRLASDKEKKQLHASKLFVEAKQSIQINSIDSLHKTAEQLSEVCQLFRETDQIREEIECWNVTAAVNENLGRKETVLESFQKALGLQQKLNDRKGQADTLINIGLFFFNLEQSEKAIDQFRLALSITREIGYKSGEANSLTAIATAYTDLGDKSKALDYLRLSVPIYKVINDKEGEADALSLMAGIYSSFGEYQKALEYFMEALPVFRESGFKDGEMSILQGMARLYGDLGENAKSLEMLEQVLTITRSEGNKSFESSILNNIGRIYEKLDDKKQALDFYNQSLALKQDNDKMGTAKTLSNIGSVQMELGEFKKALDNFHQALKLQEQIKDKAGQSITLNNIGLVYGELGEFQKALELYQQSLILAQEISSPIDETYCLHNIMTAWAALKQPRLAIFYGKLAVNRFQDMRQLVQTFDIATQKSFVRESKALYQDLIELLISENRLAEAHQAINMSQDQEYFDFNSSQNKPVKKLIETERESESGKEYKQVNELIFKTVHQVEQLKLQIGKSEIPAEATTIEEQQLKQLEADLKNVPEKLINLLTQIESEFKKPVGPKDKVESVIDLTEIQATLKELSSTSNQNVVAIYTLVNKKRFSLLFITAKTINKAIISVKEEQLNEQAKKFWALLQSDKYDTTKLGKELYNVVFKPIEKEIPADTKTILWSLDGNLRYIPMAALFDGKHYLIERYNHVNFTRADKLRVTHPTELNWTGLGLGTSAAKTVSLLGNKISFSALPGVSEELKLLFKQNGKSEGIFEGLALQDENFTKQVMIDSIRQKRPTLVHIASHFSFRPGDEARTFLLLGDGTPFTLAEMKEQRNLFAGVELLTLSACNTAAQQNGNGREIDAFSELAQRLGARAVLATLWSVADNSTPWLMREFYDLKFTRNENKAEALRKAQLSLLKGTALVKPTITRNDLSSIKIIIGKETNGRQKKSSNKTRSEIIFINDTLAPPFVSDKTRPFAHPFYWSAFILFGNWQ